MGRPDPGHSSQVTRVGYHLGDVKADNVLIDKEDNAIIIDLEGGTTQGWVDQDKANTLEGDSQGMERMMDFIFNDQSTLRPSDEERSYRIEED